MSKILILAPHTDDGEFGCGGTIAKHVENQDEVWYIAFSTCKESLPQGYTVETITNELYEATQTLGINRENVIVLDYPVRRFAEHRQDILEDIIKYRKQINPDIIYSPSIHDTHQDHNVIAEEARRAFKNVSIYAYEVPWNNFTFNNQRFSVLNPSHVEKKLNAILCYRSQNGRAYSSDEYIKGQVKYHGVQVNREYAEVFEVVREVEDK